MGGSPERGDNIGTGIELDADTTVPKNDHELGGVGAGAGWGAILPVPKGDHELGAVGASGNVRTISAGSSGTQTVSGKTCSKQVLVKFEYAFLF